MNERQELIKTLMPRTLDEKVNFWIFRKARWFWYIIHPLTAWWHFRHWNDKYDTNS